MVAGSLLDFDWTVALMVIGVLVSLFTIFFYLRPGE
jgi:hypothetical protein